jgi:hypothetical protein
MNKFILLILKLQTEYFGLIYDKILVTMDC